MNKLRNFIEGGCCLATVLTLTAMALSAALVGVLVWWDATSSVAAFSPIPTPTPAPVSAFSPITTPTSTPIPKPPLPLRVLKVAPADGSEGVMSLTAIKVTFNQPMVALQAATDHGQFPVPIVILPETVRLCEEYGLNPLGVIASGALLIAARPKDSQGVLSALSRAGIAAAVIATTTAQREVCWEDGSPLPRFERDEVARLFHSS